MNEAEVFHCNEYQYESNILRLLKEHKKRKHEECINKSYICPASVLEPGDCAPRSDKNILYKSSFARSRTNTFERELTQLKLSHSISLSKYVIASPYT